MKEKKIASYAAGNTPYINAENIDKLISSLEESPITLFMWFTDNRLTANDDECHLVVTGTQKANVSSRQIHIQS